QGSPAEAGARPASAGDEPHGPRGPSGREVTGRLRPGPRPPFARARLRVAGSSTAPARRAAPPPEGGSGVGVDDAGARPLVLATDGAGLERRRDVGVRHDVENDLLGPGLVSRVDERPEEA